MKKLPLLETLTFLFQYYRKKQSVEKEKQIKNFHSFFHPLPSRNSITNSLLLSNIQFHLLNFFRSRGSEKLNNNGEITLLSSSITKIIFIIHTHFLFIHRFHFPYPHSSRFRNPLHSFFQSKLA